MNLKNRFSDINFIVHSFYDMENLYPKFDIIVGNKVMIHLKEPKVAINSLKKITHKYFLTSVPREPVFRLANIIGEDTFIHGGDILGQVQHWTKRTLILSF